MNKGLPMTYQVTARKWRPQNLDELIGQKHLSNALINAIENKRIAHAYLFSGPRGVGKTSSARIFAKSLNCETGITTKPCQTCSNCIEITNGSSYDVLEIDGASNRGIDQIRELRDNVKYLPNKSHYKIIIIDEVHMLTDQAFNALLKTLEEPPSHVIFIFATTEAHKVKITIRSRCQHYHFRQIPTSLIQEHLQKIIQSEGITIEDKALYQIAKAGDGSMRDSQSLLDQVIAYSDKNITVEKVEEILGVFSEERYYLFIDSLTNNNILNLLKFSQQLATEGVDLIQFTTGLIGYFRNLLIILTTGEENSLLLDIPSEVVSELNKYIDSFTEQQLLDVINLLTQLIQDLKKASNQQFYFESSLYRLVDYQNFIHPAEIIERFEVLEQEILKQFPSVAIQKKPLLKSTDLPLEKKQDRIINDNSFSTNENVNQNNTYQQWKQFKTELHNKKPMLEGFLSHAMDIKIDETEIHITFNDTYSHEEFSKKDNQKILEEIYYDLLKKKMKFVSHFQEGKPMSEEDKSKQQSNISSLINTFNGKVISGDL